MFDFLMKKNDEFLEVKEEKFDKLTEFKDKPKICLFDLDKSFEYLVKLGYNCSDATLGKQIVVPNTYLDAGHFCRLNLDYPSNLHEYNIVVLDMGNPEKVIYDKETLNNVEHNGNKLYGFISEYPETIFDPRGVSSLIIKERLRALSEKETIFIIFADKEEKIKYNYAEISSQGMKITEVHEHSNYSFKDIPFKQNKYGKEINILNINSELSSLLNRFKDQFSYFATFYHPIVWNGKESVENKNFLPLIENADKEIVSFALGQGKSLTFVFPQLENKPIFLEQLFSRFLPEICPNIFPFSTKFAWVKNNEYQLPNEKELVRERKQTCEEFSQKLEEVDKKIQDNHNMYSFLYDLITQTGDNLVKAVEIYLKWLGFENVINVDETQPELKEEDLRVDIEDGLLVIEVKGIGGTSTDNECSQISKIRYRRAEERNRFDVKGLYIVNHQRYLPPLERQNPPFCENQVKDAVNDKRGLLTTYELFKVYGLIQKGIIKKEDVRKSLTNYGLINFMPNNVVSLGIPDEYFKNGTVVILNLNNQKIQVGQKIYAYKDNEYYERYINSIQIDDNTVIDADIGEVGIQFDNPIPKKSEILLVLDNVN